MGMNHEHKHGHPNGHGHLNGQDLALAHERRLRERDGEHDGCVSAEAPAAFNSIDAFNPSAPWEALAVGAGDVNASADEDPRVAAAADAADRAAAFAALLSGRSGVNVVAGGDVSSASPPALRTTRLLANVALTAASGSSNLPDASSGASGRFDDVSSMVEDDDNDDDELKAVKKKMASQLAALARRRAEITGNGTPSSVTVSKFTNELRRWGPGGGMVDISVDPVRRKRT